MSSSLSSLCTSRLLRDYAALQSSPIEGISVRLSEENLSTVLADLSGPEATPFHGGIFTIRLSFGGDFPSQPPQASFLTKIFHPNVSKTGEICVNALKKDWKASHGLRHILMVIRCLLIVPNPESALNEDAGRLLLENYDDYAKRAQILTNIHAKSRGKEKEKEESEKEKEKEEGEKRDENVNPAVNISLPVASKVAAVAEPAKRVVKKPLKRL